MDYWGRVADLLASQTSRARAGVSGPSRAAAVADGSCSGLLGTGAAAIVTAVAKDVERSQGEGRGSKATNPGGPAAEGISGFGLRIDYSLKQPGQ